MEMSIFCNLTKMPSAKPKVLVIMGTTAAGKTRLSIELATHYSAEIINSDKMQVYKGFDIVTARATESERRGVPHHLFEFIDQLEMDFTAQDFCHHASLALDQIIGNGKLPIIIGGSNSFIKALIDDPQVKLTSRFDCCFIWISLSLSVVHANIEKRLNTMVAAGLVDEVREYFDFNIDYTKGAYRSIGVPELDDYFKAEKKGVDKLKRETILRNSIEKIKINTCQLATDQLNKIKNLKIAIGSAMHQIDATAVFEKSGRDADDEYERVVLKRSFAIVDEFLKAAN